MNDNRYPKHIEDLCQAILDGDETGWAPLHDALIEAGYPATAEYHCKNAVCLERPDECTLVRVAIDNSVYGFGRNIKSPSDIERQAAVWLGLSFRK